jgi:predicted aspartyl protease
MKGVVDEYGRANIPVSIRASTKSKPVKLAAWIDTAFDGELVLPKRFIESLRLEQRSGIIAELANGKSMMLESFECVVAWFKRDYPVEDIGNDGDIALLGIGLLVGHRLTIDYTKRTATIT